MSRSLAKLNPTKNQKRVVVVGGGFAGFACTEILDKNERFHVTLIDTKDHFEYTPAIVKHLVKREIPLKNMTVRHEEYLMNGFLMIGAVHAVYKDHVRIKNKKIPFDYLVIATGAACVVDFPSGRRMYSYRTRDLVTENDKIVRSNRVNVVGGGCVGCEMAASIKATYPRKVVTLIEKEARLLTNMPQDAHTIALKKLTELGVRVVLEQMVLDVKADHTCVTLVDEYNCDHVVLAVGQTPLSGLLTPKLLDMTGHIRVDEHLQVRGYTNLFAAGDVTSCPSKNVHAACCAGTTVARNITRTEINKPLTTHEVSKTTRYIYLGNQALSVMDTSNNNGKVKVDQKYHYYKEEEQVTFIKLVQEAFVVDGVYGRRQ